MSDSLRKRAKHCDQRHRRGEFTYQGEDYILEIVYRVGGPKYRSAFHKSLEFVE